MLLDKVKILTDDGIRCFEEYLDSCRQNNKEKGKPPYHLLDSSTYSTQAPSEILIDKNPKVHDRYDMGMYLFKQIGDEGFKRYYEDVGFWSWLALYYFEYFCPDGKDVLRKEHYILSVGKYRNIGNPIDYRHCVRTPVLVVNKFPEIAKFILLGTEGEGRGLHEMGDIVEQTLSKPKILGSSACLEVIKGLYINNDGYAKTACSSYPKKKKLKSGKWSKQGYGGLRRLTEDVLPRFKLTYNLELMPPLDIISYAGKEFLRWKEIT